MFKLLNTDTSLLAFSTPKRFLSLLWTSPKVENSIPADDATAVKICFTKLKKSDVICFSIDVYHISGETFETKCSSNRYFEKGAPWAW